MTLRLRKLQKFQGRWSWNEKTLEANIKAAKPDYNEQDPRTWPFIELSLIEKTNGCIYTGYGALPRSVVYEQIIVDRYLDAHPGIMLENRKRAEVREAEAKAAKVKKETKRQFMEELDTNTTEHIANLKHIKPKEEQQDTKEVKLTKTKHEKGPNRSKRISTGTKLDQYKKDSKPASSSRTANVKIEKKKKDGSKSMIASGTKRVKLRQDQNSKAKPLVKKVTNVNTIRTRSHGMFSTAVCADEPVLILWLKLTLFRPEDGIRASRNGMEVILEGWRYSIHGKQ